MVIALKTPHVHVHVDVRIDMRPIQLTLVNITVDNIDHPPRVTKYTDIICTTVSFTRLHIQANRVHEIESPENPC